MVDSIKAALSLLLPIQEDFVYEDIEFDKNGKAEYIVRGYSHEWQVHLRETLDKDMASLYSGINAMAKTQEEKQLAAWLISKNILPSEIYNVMTQLDENVSKLWRSSLLLRIRYLQYIIELINFPSLNKMLVDKFKEQKINVQNKLFVENHMAFNRLSINILGLMIGQAQEEISRRHAHHVGSTASSGHLPARHQMGHGIPVPITEKWNASSAAMNVQIAPGAHIAPLVEVSSRPFKNASSAAMNVQIAPGAHIAPLVEVSSRKFKNASSAAMNVEIAPGAHIAPLVEVSSRTFKNAKGVTIKCDSEYYPNGVSNEVCYPDHQAIDRLASWNAEMNGIRLEHYAPPSSMIMPSSMPSSVPSMSPASLPPHLAMHNAAAADALVEEGMLKFAEYLMLMRILVAIVVIVIIYFLVKWMSSPSASQPSL